MSYRLAVNEPIEQSVPRILTAELDKASAHIEAIVENPKAVHAARKSLKRTRALFVLVEPITRGKMAKAADKRVSAVAKSLGSARDRQVVVDAADALEKDFAGGAHAQLFSDVRSWLQARRDRIGEKCDPAQLQTSLVEIEDLKASLRLMKFRDGGIEALLTSAQHTYAIGRSFMGVALEKESERALHDWRKLVQRHWRHMTLFSEAWAQESKARIALAHALSETLGTHQDFAMLRATIADNKVVFSDVSDIKVLFAGIDAKQRALVLKAAVQGERLFAEKPKAFMKRFGVYWKTARQGQNYGEAQALPAVL